MEQIALPAIPSALNTWTGSFGFTKMDELERLQFVNHTFLNFPDTIMCQKQLLNAPSMESTMSNGISFALDTKMLQLLKCKFSCIQFPYQLLSRKLSVEAC